VPLGGGAVFGCRAGIGLGLWFGWAGVVCVNNVDGDYIHVNTGRMKMRMGKGVRNVDEAGWGW
jgi:hypothetical protein